MKKLVVNADDFGFTRDVNRGIVEAHCEGILTATTLMANGAAFEDAHAQAAVLDLYSPDRVMSDKCPGVMQGTAARRWDDFDRYARESAEAVLTAKGKGLYVLTDQAPCPSLRALREAVKGKLPHVSWHSYEACDTGEALTGTEIPFGARLVARYRFDRAERVLALDSDFLGQDSTTVLPIKQFSKGRRPEQGEGEVRVVELTA